VHSRTRPVDWWRRIVGAGRAKRVHKIRPASVDELATLTNESAFGPS
jgi:hypothetical protein